MPIYDYRCRTCGGKFELLVLKHSTAACPTCQGQDLEQLISAFAVSSESIRQANIQTARRRHAASKDFKDKQVAEAEDIKAHEDH